jgi:site-specific recombinase XerC
MRGWLEGIRPTLRPRTWERYEGVVRVHLLPSLGGVSLGKLGPHHLQRLYRALLGQGLRPATVRYVHAVVHRTMEQAVRWRLLPLNPASLVSPPRLDRREDAVDLEAGVLSVVGTLQRLGRELVLAEPKTARSRRRVELTTTAVEALRRRRTVQLQERLAAGPLWEERGLVITDAIGRPLQPYVARHAFTVLLRRAELRPVRFHDLRHTAATLLLSRGIHPKIVSEMLGHATIAITLDLYSHVTPSMQREAVRELDALLRGSGPGIIRHRAGPCDNIRVIGRTEGGAAAPGVERW